MEEATFQQRARVSFLFGFVSLCDAFSYAISFYRFCSEFAFHFPPKIIKNLEGGQPSWHALLRLQCRPSFLASGGIGGVPRRRCARASITRTPAESSGEDLLRLPALVALPLRCRATQSGSPLACTPLQRLPWDPAYLRIPAVLTAVSLSRTFHSRSTYTRSSVVTPSSCRPPPADENLACGGAVETDAAAQTDARIACLGPLSETRLLPRFGRISAPTIR